MNPRLLIVLVVIAAVLLALAGWTVQGARWLASRPGSLRPRLATA